MTETTAPTIGVLALQGAFAEHVQILARLGVNAREVRKVDELDGLDGLIIPGGESTSMALVAERWGLIAPLRAWVNAGRPVWGTCAGMILLADHADGQKRGGQMLIGGLDVTVNRNYFGRQTESFVTVLDAPQVSAEPIPAVFIRAPAITALGPKVEALASLPGKEDEKIYVAVRQGSILATAFHPELTDDLRWHHYFLAMLKGSTLIPSFVEDNIEKKKVSSDVITAHPKRLS